MQDEPQNEKATSQEVSASKAISDMSARVDTIIAESSDGLNPRYFGVKTIISDEGLETASLYSTRTGGWLSRTTDQQTGAVLYDMGLLYHDSNDKGQIHYRWSPLEAGVSCAIDSDMNGHRPLEAKSDPAEVVSVQSLLEKYFPEQPAEPKAAKQTFAQRVLARLLG